MASRQASARASARAAGPIASSCPQAACLCAPSNAGQPHDSKMSHSTDHSADSVARSRPPGVNEFSVRAIICGLVVAVIMGASYPYVVLKLGFGPNVSVVAAIFGYLILGIFAAGLTRAFGRTGRRSIAGRTTSSRRLGPPRRRPRLCASCSPRSTCSTRARSSSSALH